MDFVLLSEAYIHDLWLYTVLSYSYN